MRRAKKKLDPQTWIVTDSRQALSPPFYHEDLAWAVLKELSRHADGLDSARNPVAMTVRSWTP